MFDIIWENTPGTGLETTDFPITDHGKTSESLNNDYRIKAAHPLKTIDKDVMELCRNIVFKSQELLKLIVKDIDKEWPLMALSFK